MRSIINRHLLCCTLALGMSISAGAARATPTGISDLAACQDDEAPLPVRIAKCTSVISTTGLAPEVLAEAHLNRGIARQEGDETALSMADFNAAIQLNPEYPAPYYYRGMLHAQLENMPVAIADMTKAIMLDSSSPEFLEARAHAYLATSQFALALRDFDAMIALDESDPSGFFGRGMAHEASGNRPAAVADYRKALQLDPTHEEATAALKRINGQS